MSCEYMTHALIKILTIGKLKKKNDVNINCTLLYCTVCNFYQHYKEKTNSST